MANATTDWLRLAQAAEAIGVSVKTLRLEANRGRLKVWRVAGKDFTSLEEIERMKEACLRKVEGHISGSVRQDPATDTQSKPSGSSKTEEKTSAQDALRLKLRKLKENSPTISRPNTKRHGQNVTYLK